jgi:hypothetical protein
MKKITSVFALVIAFASAVFAGLAFSDSMEEVNLSSPSASIFEANTDFDLNSLNTDNVYQQIVVANWGTKDMTQVVASELGSLRSRVDFLVEQQITSTSLLAVAVFLLGVMTLLTAMSNFQSRKSADESPEPESSVDSTQTDSTAI